MKLKFLFATACCIILSTVYLKAQDYIFLRVGQVKHCIVRDVYKDNIRYFNNDKDTVMQYHHLIYVYGYIKDNKHFKMNGLRSTFVDDVSDTVNVGELLTKYKNERYGNLNQYRTETNINTQSTTYPSNLQRDWKFNPTPSKNLASKRFRQGGTFLLLSATAFTITRLAQHIAANDPKNIGQSYRTWSLVGDITTGLTFTIGASFIIDGGIKLDRINNQKTIK
jgi:hypothetical protein